MTQLNEMLAKELVSAYMEKIGDNQCMSRSVSCSCQVCYGTGKLSIPFLGWTWCGCDRKATPHWDNHDH
jgi:hypothetical protein